MFAHVTKGEIQPQIETQGFGCLHIHICTWTIWQTFHHICSFSQYTQMSVKSDSAHSNIDISGVSTSPECRCSMLSEHPWGIPAGIWLLILEVVYIPRFKYHNCSPMSTSGAFEVAWESYIYVAELISRSQNTEITSDTQGLHRTSEDITINFLNYITTKYK